MGGIALLSTFILVWALWSAEAGGSMSLIAKLRTDNDTMMMDLRHVHHPESPYKVKGATAKEEAQAIMAASMAHVRRLRKRITGTNRYNEELYGSHINPQSEVIQGPRLAYYVQMLVGTPSVPNTFLVDAIGDITWLQCLPCSACFPQGPIPYFDPTSSSSFKAMPCPSDDCNHAASLPDFGIGCADGQDSGHCNYRSDYTDGGLSAGWLAYETFNLDAHILTDMSFGCSHTAKEAQSTFGSGVLALGAGDFSFSQQLKKGMFFCLPMGSDMPGFAGIGTVPQTLHTVHVPLMRSEKHPTGHYVPLKYINMLGDGSDGGISITQVDGTEQGVLIDPGVPVTVLLQETYEKVRDMFRAAAEKKGYPKLLAYDDMFDTCYSVDEPNGLPPAPWMVLHFDGGVTLLRSENIISTTVIPGLACFAFTSASNFKVPLNILGAAQLAGSLVTVDTVTKTVGFSAGVCT